MYPYILFVTIAFFLLLIGVSIYVNKSNKNYDDYTLGGKSVKWYAIGSNMSAGLFGASSLMTCAFYARVAGLSSVWLIFFPSLIGLLLLGIFLAKRIRRLGVDSNVYSISEMINIKYGPKVRMVYVIIIVLALVSFAVSGTIALGKLVSYYTGLNQTLVMAIGAILCAVYVMIGGYKGVAVTSVFQAVIMVFSVIALAVAAVAAGGGMEHIMSVWKEIPEFTSLFSSSFPVIQAIGWIAIMGLPILTSQDMHQKVISAKSDKDVVKAIALAFVICVLLYTFGMASGMFSVAWDVPPSDAANSEFFVAWASETLFGPVMMTIVFIGFAAAIITTLASALSGASLAFSRDLVYYYKPDIPEAKLVKITRWAVAGAALIGFLVATVVPNILTALYLTGNIQAAGLTLPLFAYFFSKKATSQGVLWSAVIATAFVIIDFALRQAGVALPWPGEPLSVLITLGLSFVVLVIVSACTQQKMQKLDA